jgi:zinc transport system substrate-binding protein
LLLKRKVYIILILFLLFSVLIYPKTGWTLQSRIKIITTIFPLMEFSKAVCGERGEVRLLLPPGAEVHTWKPRPSDVIRISSADLFIFIGADLEPWIHDLLESTKNPDLRVLDVSQALSLKKESHTQHSHGHSDQTLDPHMWLDFGVDQVIVDKIANVLSEVNPEDSSYFKRNAALYKDKLAKLDEKFKEGLKDCVHRTIILGGHSAFGYLAKRYNLEQISLYGLSPNAKPTPRKLVEVVELAEKYGIKAIYFEIYVSDELAKVMAKEVGAKTSVLNPGANLTKEQLNAGTTFFDIMEANLENLRDGLLCR